MHHMTYLPEVQVTELMIILSDSMVELYEQMCHTLTINIMFVLRAGVEEIAV